jgi:hypothetical protein
MQVRAVKPLAASLGSQSWMLALTGMPSWLCICTSLQGDTLRNTHYVHIVEQATSSRSTSDATSGPGSAGHGSSSSAADSAPWIAEASLQVHTLPCLPCSKMQT